MLVRNAELSSGRIRDLRVREGRIIQIELRLRPLSGEEDLDAAGCAVLPGLHDHHVHLRAQAATAHSVNLASVTDEDGMRTVLGEAQRQVRPGAWLRVVGYHESLAGDLDRTILDSLTVNGTPIRVQHRSGIVWVLNSAALTAAGLDANREEGIDLTTGTIWRRDDLVRRISELDPAELRCLGTEAAALGITGFTDATPGTGPSHAFDLARDLRAAGVVQSLHLMAPVGATPPDQPRSVLGPVKVLLDDHDLPALQELVDTITAAHAEHRGVAFHCVTRVQLVLAVAALDTAGSRTGDRIEHGSVIPTDLVGPLAQLGVAVVTQPHFITERGDDYLHDVDAADVGSLYRIRSLQRAGIAVVAGTDAPFGAFDPWASIASAVDRTTRLGHLMGADEGVDLSTAMRMYLGHPDRPGRPRRVAVGSPADLCVLSVPWQSLPEAIAERPVSSTIIGGILAHHR